MADELPRFERFCSALVLEDGMPMELEPFQRGMLADYFGGTVETLIILSKKNGKTTLLAALALYHLITTPEAECVVAAASRDQATILYDAAAGFIRRTPGLKTRAQVKRGYREIQSARDTGRIRVLAADVDTADGVLPTLALVDELHRHKSAGLYGVFRDGLGPRGGRMITISTAGADEQAPLGVMRAAARKLPTLERDRAYLHAVSTDRAFAMHEWALSDTDDLDDMVTVKLANPASWQTEEALALRHDSPSMLPWQWARFACGIWIGAEAWWISGEDWNAGEVVDWIEWGDRITLGFDGSRTGDATAIIACRVSDGLLEPLGVWEAPSDGREWEVPASAVDAVLAQTMERYRVLRGYFDPPFWQSEIDAWAREYGEERIVRYPTNRTRMMAATERFRTDLAAGKLHHGGDLTLRQHVLSAQTKEARNGYWLTKARTNAPGKIDAAVAAVLAYEARSDCISEGLVRERSKVPVSL